MSRETVHVADLPRVNAYREKVDTFPTREMTRDDRQSSILVNDTLDRNVPQIGDN